jgi:hypothetical protein
MNIFYSQLDENLRKELDARGQAGIMDRTNASLDFMLGKIANVQVTAYEGTGSASKVVNTNNMYADPLPSVTQFNTVSRNDYGVGVLGGATVTSDRYLPSGPMGYLTNKTITKTSIDFHTDPQSTDFKAYQQANLDPKLGEAYVKSTNATDRSKRIGPYLTGLDVTIGDHSMGLLNKATITFIIPNPERDLDDVENVWFRPGRFVRIDVVHPTSALVSLNLPVSSTLITNGLLTENSIPNAERLKELYPGWNIEALQNDIARMNVFTFEGLITSFEFSYTSDGTVEASLSLTGTSNVYADVSMYIKNADTKADDTTTAEDPAVGKDATIEKINGVDTYITSSNVNAFYGALYERVEYIISSYLTRHNIARPKEEITILTHFTTDQNPTNAATDHFVLAGEMYDSNIVKTAYDQRLQEFYEEQQRIANSNEPPEAGTPPISILPPEPNAATYERYITLGALVQFINDTVFSKYKAPGTETSLGIIHTDAICFSNYYSSLTSCVPENIILLPETPSKKDDMNWHGDLGYYANVLREKTKQESAVDIEIPWKGIYSTLPNDKTVMFPSRIFINLKFIEKLVEQLTKKNIKAFRVSAFIAGISAEILYATGGAINLKLVSGKPDVTKLNLVDTMYTKGIDPHSSANVIPYAVPMFANHPKGTIVRDFRLNATLPDSVKNLSYVLNSGDDISSDQIAPYMNFMYNSRDAKSINTALKQYKQKHTEIIKKLNAVRIENGQYPDVSNNIQKLYQCLLDYLKIPTDDITKSQQITAPIFPFSAEFTIDGINGFRYGDVLTFHALPSKYRVNTVFSVISVQHTVSSEGEWTTKVTCIMRPSID